MHIYLSESIFKIKRGFGTTTTTTTTKNLDLLLGTWKHDKSVLIKLNYITRLFYCDKRSNAGFGHWTGNLKFRIKILAYNVHQFIAHCLIPRGY